MADEQIARSKKTGDEIVRDKLVSDNDILSKMKSGGQSMKVIDLEALRF